jgi:Icc protein
MTQPIRLIQISDTHLCDPPGGLLESTQITDDSLRRVLEQIAWLEPDAVVVTGDLAQDPAASTYQRLGGMLSELPCPIFTLPGNHDDVELYRQHLRVRGEQPVRRARLSAWQLLLLDSTAPHEPQSGHMEREELEWLVAMLEQHQQQHALICMHHAPVAIGCPWMDGIALKNSPEFIDLISRFHHIKGVLFGHIHQEYHSILAAVPYFGTPSTCVQFVPRAGACQIDVGCPPAYRLLELHPNGDIVSRVEYLHHPA